MVRTWKFALRQIEISSVKIRNSPFLEILETCYTFLITEIIPFQNLFNGFRRIILLRKKFFKFCEIFHFFHILHLILKQTKKKGFIGLLRSPFVQNCLFLDSRHRFAQTHYPQIPVHNRCHCPPDYNHYRYFPVQGH
jgi:hypothetical protein